MRKLIALAALTAILLTGCRSSYYQDAYDDGYAAGLDAGQDYWYDAFYDDGYWDGFNAAIEFVQDEYGIEF